VNDKLITPTILFNLVYPFAMAMLKNDLCNDALLKEKNRAIYKHWSALPIPFPCPDPYQFSVKKRHIGHYGKPEQPQTN
jgi:hypothetical protein